MGKTESTLPKKPLLSTLSIIMLVFGTTSAWILEIYSVNTTSFFDIAYAMLAWFSLIFFNFVALLLAEASYWRSEAWINIRGMAYAISVLAIPFSIAGWVLLIETGLMFLF